MHDPGPESARSRPSADSRKAPRGTVFLTDPSAEAERVGQALRSDGWQVVDVPLSLLAARVAVQRPGAVLLDVDADGALDVLARVREVPGAAEVAVLFFGEPKKTVQDAADAAAKGASGFFCRPLDIGAIVAKLAAVAVAGDPTPPASVPSSRRRETGLDSALLSSSAPPAPPSLLPPSLSPAALLEAPEGWGLSDGVAVGTQLSEELQKVLANAEERVGSSMALSSEPPSPDEEVDAVLPAALLEALDEPMEFDDDDDCEGSAQAWAATPARRATTGARASISAETNAGGTNGGPREAEKLAAEEKAEPKPFSRTQSFAPPDFRAETPPPAKPRPVTNVADDDAERETPRPPRGRSSYQPPSAPPLPIDGADARHEGAAEWTQPVQPAATGVGTNERFETPAPISRAHGTVDVPPPSPQRASQAASPRPQNVALVPGESLRVLARAAADRYSGTLCFDAGGGLRRVVLRDGDLLTAGSSFDDETLVAFLVGRGELPKDVGKKLAGRLAPFGRHAGAALIAHGHLGQDRLWEVLRSHVEWIVGKILVLDGGTCTFEGEPPGRLKTEPSVFGGSTGAEVLVEVSRRVIPPNVALARLGGQKARLANGPRRSLLAECALDPRESDIVERSASATIEELVALAGSPEFASVLLALVALGIIETLAPSKGASGAPPAEHDPLDDEALRERVRARLELVEEGDYFAVLGIAKDATPYEIRRAYVELRRSFEPGRVLTAATADLLPSITTILEVLDEAYEILRDATRRERYRRAIEAASPS